MKYTRFKIVRLITIDRFLILLFTLMGCSLFINSCGSNSQKISSLPQDSQIQVYFNHNQAVDRKYQESYRNLERNGDDLEAVIIEQINSATTSIDIAVQELNLSKIARSIIQQKNKGIRVRIVLENNYNIPTDKLPDKHGLTLLKQNNIPIIDDTEDGSKGSGLMHHKFMVIDGQKVLTGSANFTLSGIHGDFDNLETRGNTNHILVINSPDLAQLFTEEFNYLWGDGVGGKKDSLFGLKKPQRVSKTISLDRATITVKFSPDSPSSSWQNSSNGLISQTLQIANDSIDLALFVFSDQQIANTMEKEALEGVQIRALIDRSFAYRYYSEGLDLLGVEILNKCRYEKNNRPWKQPITTVGIPSLAKGDKLHHKFAIIDTYTVITGSHNWSNAANHTNDETLLIIYNQLVATHFQREFDSLYNNVQLGLPSQIETKMEEEKEKCS